MEMRHTLDVVYLGSSPSAGAMTFEELYERYLDERTPENLAAINMMATRVITKHPYMKKKFAQLAEETYLDWRERKKSRA